MTRLAAVFLGLGLGFGVAAALSAPGCYDPNNPPPCDPTTIDWPRCRHPTDPPMAPRDAGAERE